jgi:hypothetical protein
MLRNCSELLERFRAAFSQGLEALSVYRKWRAASWASDLGLRFQLTKPLIELVIAVGARHRELRVAQQIDHLKPSGKKLLLRIRRHKVRHG